MNRVNGRLLRTRIPRSFRSYSQYNYQYQQYQQYQPPRTSWTKRILYTGIGLAGFGSYVYYFWWPKHTFPSSVAKILRKGLWAESDKGENDYQLALKYYLEAIDHCHEIEVDPLSDEYTGIQLKVGEMFERLDMLEDAAFVYNEIATLYLKVLTATPNSEDGKRVRSRDHRAHLIQKDLRLAIKLVELNKANAQLSKAILMTHLLIAQDEVHKKLGPNGNISRLTPNTSGSDYKATIDSTSIEISNDGITTTINKNPSAWEPFVDEFFNAMDLLTAICISTGDLAMASKIKISMTEWMLLADVEPHKVLLSQCNLASLLYLQAEEYESKEVAYKRKFFEDSGLNFDDYRNSPQETLKDSDVLEKLDKEIEQHQRNEYLLVIQNKEKCIELSIKSYESVLEFAKNLPQEIISNNNTINETVALATYGLGVVNLHLAQYEKAERLLREARVRSKTCGYDDLILEIERELSKLFKEKKLLEKGKRANKGDIEMDIHMKK